MLKVVEQLLPEHSQRSRLVRTVCANRVIHPTRDHQPAEQDTDLDLPISPHYLTPVELLRVPIPGRQDCLTCQQNPESTSKCPCYFPVEEYSRI